MGKGAGAGEVTKGRVMLPGQGEGALGQGSRVEGGMTQGMSGAGGVGHWRINSPPRG